MAPPPAHCVCHLPRSGRGGWRYAPSPYGDMVLKYGTQRNKKLRSLVSVPLRGFPYLSFPRRYGGSGEQREPMGALVPCVHFCRYGWFTACVHGAPSGTLRVPPPPLWQGRLEIRSVPLRGFPYLSFPRRYGGSGEQREPMGALVACIHF